MNFRNVAIFAATVLASALMGASPALAISPDDVPSPGLPCDGKCKDDCDKVTSNRKSDEWNSCYNNCFTKCLDNAGVGAKPLSALAIDEGIQDCNARYSSRMRACKKPPVAPSHTAECQEQAKDELETCKQGFAKDKVSGDLRGHKGSIHKEGDGDGDGGGNPTSLKGDSKHF